MTNSINESNIVLVTDVSPLKCGTRFIKKKSTIFVVELQLTVTKSASK